MIKTIVFNGGLGNQMFQYAFYLQLKRMRPFDFFLFDIEQAQECHNGYELSRVFNNIDSTKQIKNNRRLKRYCPRLLNAFNINKQDDSLPLKFNPALLTSNFLTKYDGYWQSEKYFSSVIEKVRKTFVFNENNTNKRTHEIAFQIKKENSVAVHVRRGDYLLHSEIFGVCSLNYYNDAIALINKKTANPFFYFFSDDIEWVKRNIKCSNAEYITWNKDKDNWQDMYLMSCCKHNIIANSSFSWWGAWLNNHPDKIVIAPQKWFKYSPNYDILPSEWITINN